MTKSDYLAYIPFFAGGSYGRSSDRVEAIRLAYRNLVSDWGSTFDIYDGSMECAVANVSGFDKVYMNSGLISAKLKDGTKHDFDCEVIDVRIPELKGDSRKRYQKPFEKKLEAAILKAVE